MIEPISLANIEKILPLIRQYQEFYQVEEICDQHNKNFFSQFGIDKQSGCQFIYVVENQPVAFATVYFTFASTITSKVAVMNDLYTVPSYRGQGIARQLIQCCYEYGIEQGAVRLQWLTAKNNTQAQSLYDAIGAAKSNWVFYSYNPPR